MQYFCRLSLLIHAQDFQYFDATVCKVQWFNAEFIDLKSEERTDERTDGRGATLKASP